MRLPRSDTWRRGLTTTIFLLVALAIIEAGARTNSRVPVMKDFGGYSAGRLSVSDDVSGGASWMITLDVPDLQEATMESTYIRNVRAAAGNAAKTGSLCAMSVSLSAHRSRVALTCPSNVSILPSMVQQFKATYGSTRVRVVRNQRVYLPPLHARRSDNNGTTASWSASALPMEALAGGSQTGAAWHLDRINSRARQYDGVYSYDDDCAGADVWVIDTGVRTSHMEFEGRATWVANTIDRNNVDCVGHGTHVAGTIGGKTYGVCKRARIKVIKALDCKGYGTTFTVATGVDAAVSGRDPERATIINLSLNADQDDGFDATIRDAIFTHGIAIVVAAGNSGTSACSYSPSNILQALSTVATGQGDTLASFSNHGSCTRIAAPGVNILSAWHTSNTATNVISGTSMAAPIVSGITAMEWSRIANKRDATLAMDAVVAHATPGVVTNDPSGVRPPLVYSRLLQVPAPVPTPSPPPPPPVVASPSPVLSPPLDQITRPMPPPPLDNNGAGDGQPGNAADEQLTPISSIGPLMLLMCILFLI